MEPRRAYDVHIDNNSSSSFHSGDFSLLEDIDGSYPNGDINQVNFDFTNMHSTLNEATHDPNTDVSSQLTKLISDNLSLKDALDKNNVMMKEQLNTISSWRDVMLLKTQKQQQSLQEAKEKVSSLEKENSNLLMKLDSLLKEMHENKEIKDFCTKCETLESTLNSLFGEKEFIKNDRGIMNSELSIFYDNLQQNLIVICHHLNALLKHKMDQKEKNLLKTFILLLKFKIASLNGSFCATVQTDEETGYEIVQQIANKEESVNEGSQVSSEIVKKLVDFEKIIKEKDDELNLIKNERDKLSEEVKVYDLKIQDLERQFKAQFELLSSKLNIESSALQKCRERCEILQEQIDEYQVKLDRAKMSDIHSNQELHQKIQDLQEILKMEQRANQQDKEEHKKVMLNCEKLQVDYERVTKLLEVVSRDEKEKIEKLQTLNDSNEKAYLEKIDCLTAQLFEAEEQLNESYAKVRELEEKLSLVKEESENIPALKAEIQVHRTDLMNTLAAKNHADEEIERLTNELKRYQENSDSISGNCSSSPSRQNGSNTSPKVHRYKSDLIACPVCQNEFTSMRAAENHINRCLEDNK